VSYPIYLPAIGNRLGEEIDAEVARARAKFPQPNPTYIALCEEVGEVAKALLEKRSYAEIRAEAIQVAAMAVRLIQEGDPTMGRTFDHDHETAGSIRALADKTEGDS